MQSLWGQGNSIQVRIKYNIKIFMILFDILEYMDQRMHLCVIPAEHSLADFPTPRRPTNVTQVDLVLLT